MQLLKRKNLRKETKIKWLSMCGFSVAVIVVVVVVVVVVVAHMYIFLKIFCNR